MSRSMILVVAVLAALAGSLGWLLLRKEDAAPSAGNAQRPKIAASTRPGSGSKFQPGEAGGPPPAHAGEDSEGHEKPGASGLTPFEKMKLPTTAAGFVALLREILLRVPSPFDTEEGQDIVVKIGYAFHDLLKANPQERAAALDLYRKEEHPLLMEAMTAVLGPLKMPEVAQAMSDIALGDANVERRKHALAGLGYDQDNLGAVPVAMQVLNTETDPGLLTKAMEALPDLPPGAATPAMREQVAGRMMELARAEDPYVRGTSLYLLSEWGDVRATPVLISRLQDPIMGVRAAAAFNLTSRVDQSPDVKRALLRVLADPNEDIQVRGSVADAFKYRTTNDAEVMAAVQAFHAWEAENRAK